LILIDREERERAKTKLCRKIDILRHNKKKQEGGPNKYKFIWLFKKFGAIKCVLTKDISLIDYLYGY
jgi:hypothetical protein